MLLDMPMHTNGEIKANKTDIVESGNHIKIDASISKGKMFIKILKAEKFSKYKDFGNISKLMSSLETK